MLCIHSLRGPVCWKSMVQSLVVEEAIRVHMSCSGHVNKQVLHCIR